MQWHHISLQGVVEFAGRDQQGPHGEICRCEGRWGAHGRKQAMEARGPWGDEHMGSREGRAREVEGLWEARGEFAGMAGPAWSEGRLWGADVVGSPWGVGMWKEVDVL